MDIEIIDEHRGQVWLSQTVPVSFSGTLLTGTIPYVLNAPVCQALFQLIPGDGFRIWYSTYRTGNERTILKARGVQVLELRIAVKNYIRGTLEKILSPELPELHFSLGFTPYISNRAIFEANTEYITIDFHFDREFLEELGVDFKALELFLKKVENKEPAELSPYPHVCPSEMKDAVRAILHD